MPLHRNNDSKGPYYQWGQLKKYYYIANDNVSRMQAKKKALKQAEAVYANGYKKWMNL